MDGRRVAFVPTMGSLHAGHLSLIEQAVASDFAVVLSVFVNPTQFGPTEDLAAYPRSEDRDLTLAASVGAELAFCPDVEAMYPGGASTTVSLTGPSEGLEGAIRPHHFAGVATVVCTLLNMVRPDRLILGQKDAQQVAVVRRMMRDLAFDDVELLIAPTVREPDGLAMSSRNAYLGHEDRRAALALSRALAAGGALVAQGERDARVIEAAAFAEMASQAGCEPDYAALVDPESFQPVLTLDVPSTLCVAARVGPARLIDNAVLLPPHVSHPSGV
jgi:pantoate--beta-alanine ligase